MSSSTEDTYEVLNLIGRGTFGEIRRVRRTRDGQILCRKEIMWRRMNKRQQEQLAAEMRILRDLQHNNIVRYISEVVDSDTKMVYIYMEYCGNGDLFEVIQSRKDNSPIVRFSEHTVWQIFSQLVMALYRCHNGIDPPPLEDITQPNTLGDAQNPPPRAQNIVLHRDIKPQNVFLDHNNRVKLGDFGLSKEISGQGLAETYVGTPFYMSPEIIAGRTYNAKSDIWALGCVIFEMCAFEPPFMASSQSELNRKIKIGHVASIARFGYSEALNSTIQSCLRQNEAQRPSAAGLLKRPEIILARQQLGYFDREALLMEKEIALVAREKEIERVVGNKMDEFNLREENLVRREQRVHRVEGSQATVLQDSTQRKLVDAQRQFELMAEEKNRLEQTIVHLQTQVRELSSLGPQPLTRHSDFLHRPEIFDEPMSSDDPVSIPHVEYFPGVRGGNRPSLGRAQTELVYKTDDDPLNLMPKSNNPLPRSESHSRGLRSPQRRKSQVPMSRVRPDPSTREPLAEQAAGIQGLTRALSRQDLSRITTGSENVRPKSATGMVDKNSLSNPRTPTRDLLPKTISSPRRMAYPSPTRATARTLFTESANELKRDQHLRPAPLAPLRSNTMLEGLQRAKLTRDTRTGHTAPAQAAYTDDDIPSPYIKKAYVLRPI